MKINFKINKKQSRIPEEIKVPKTMYYLEISNYKMPNLIEKKYLNKTYTFEYDEKKKILKSTDNHPKFIHGIYFDLNLKTINKLEETLQTGETYITYQHGWFTGYRARHIGHDFLIRHLVTFDPSKNNYALVNKIGYFFRKEGDEDFLLSDEEGSYIWMDYIKK